MQFASMKPFLHVLLGWFSCESLHWHGGNDGDMSCDPRRQEGWVSLPQPCDVQGFCICSLLQLEVSLPVSHISEWYSNEWCSLTDRVQWHSN